MATSISTISTIAPLAANGVYTSGSVPAAGAGGATIVGTVFSDQPGTVVVQQSYDETHWDVQNSLPVTANVGVEINEPLYAPYFRVVYTNGATTQTVFRLYVALQDVYGNFVTPQPPVTEGQFIVLFLNNSWQVVGEFNGNTGWDAMATAAIQNNRSGKYAAFDTSLGVVAQEVVSLSSRSSPSSF